ncbi:hypothetical protein ACIPEQ_04965 [Curtobacterium sp. NPDC087080]|uniref:hypothetical protein n=1 Tax=Curtobacterium sp. NPDC087080 TaxID=3363965 RepID=UPI0038251352
MNDTTRTSGLVRAAAVLVLALVGSAALAACSTSPTSSATSRAAASVGAKWGDCMRTAGFPVEDPSDDQVRSGAVTSPSGVDAERFTEASGKCASDLGVTGTDSAQKDRWKRQYAAVDSCVREQYPDAPEQQPGVIDYSSYPRAQEPQFQDTLSSCLSKHAPDTQQLDR